ncbi:hypothetical protein ABPG75_011802 [Micractinium tetrahymenae]
MAASSRLDAEILQIRARLAGGRREGEGYSAYGAIPRGAAPAGPALDGTPHSSLLATPASRHTGGRLTHQPSPSVLGPYERRLEADAGLRRPLEAAPPAGGSRFTPRSSAAARDPSPFRVAQQLAPPLQQPQQHSMLTAGRGFASIRPATGAGDSSNAAASSFAVGASFETGFSSPARKPSGMLLEQQAAPLSARGKVAASAAADPLAAYSPLPAKAATAADPLAAHLSSTARAAATVADSLAAYRPASAAKGGAMVAPPNSTASVQARLQQMQRACERTAQRNSAAVASSAGLGALAPSAWHSLQQGQGSLLPSAQVQQLLERQQQRQPDFYISAAFPGSRAGGAAVTAAQAAPAMVDGVCSSKFGSSRLAASHVATAAAATEGADEDGGGSPAAVGVRLGPVFDAMPVGGCKQQSRTAAEAAAQPQAGGSLGSSGPLSNQQTAQHSVPAANTAVLVSRLNELEAQLQMERMRSQDAAAGSSELQKRCEELRQRLQQQIEAAEAADQRARVAEQQAHEASEQAASLREEVQRRQSVHSDGVESITRLQAVSQVQRQENEELRQRLQQLGEAWEQENAHVNRLQKRLAETMATAGSGEAEAAARLRQAEAEAERRLREAAEKAQQAEQELASRCQMLAIEKVAHEQAAKQAAAKAAAAEERAAAAEARCRQLAADLDGASAGQGQQLAAARRQAEAAVETACKLQQELLEQRQRCQELEAALQGERERSSSQVERAKAAEQAQQGLGVHVKASHARLQQLQDQLAEAKHEVQRLEEQNDELRSSHLASNRAFEAQVSSLEGQLAEAQADREQLGRRLDRTTADLDAQLAAAGQQRQQLAAAQQAERELRAALEAAEASAAQSSRQALALQSKCEQLESGQAQLVAELTEAKQRAAAAEDRLAKSGRAGGSPLQELVSGLRQELQEKDLQLMQMHEDLSRERSKAQELQKQVLDQAVELDEAQRDASDVFGLRQQLASAQQAESHLRQQLAQLRQQLAASASAGGSGGGGDAGDDLSPRGSVRSGQSGGSSCSSPARLGSGAQRTSLSGRLDMVSRELAAARQEIERLKEDRDRLRDELDARDSEVMTLQGQLGMLRNQVADEANWLSPLPDPYA